jgi:alpha-N-arabinofuranosidase
VPCLKFSAVHDREAGSLTLFALNRSLDSEMRLSLVANDFSALSVTEGLVLHDGDLKAKNTRSEPDRVRPAPLEGIAVKGRQITATLPPASWNVIRLGARR